MYLITASPMGRPLYLSEERQATMSWVSNPRHASIYKQRTDASAAYRRCMVRRDWPEWARFAQIVNLEDINAA